MASGFGRTTAKVTKNKVVVNRGNQNLRRPSGINVSRLSLNNFSRKKSPTIKTTASKSTGFRRGKKTTPVKKSSNSISSFFSVFKPSSTVKSKTTSSRRTTKKSSPKVSSFRLNLDQFAKSTSLNVSGKKPQSSFSKKQSQIKNSDALNDRIKTSSLGLFAQSVLDKKTDFGKFNQDIHTVDNQNKTREQDNTIGKKVNVFFNDKSEPELPPNTVDADPFERFFEFFSNQSGSSSNTSLNTQSPEIIETGFVNDLGFPTNASEDDNPNLRPEITLQGLGGLGGDDSPNIEGEDEGKSFIEKLTENPLALGILGIGVLVLATRGKR
jgi:hypothetical protein